MVRALVLLFPTWLQELPTLLQILIVITMVLLTKLILMISALQITLDSDLMPIIPLAQIHSWEQETLVGNTALKSRLISE